MTLLLRVAYLFKSDSPVWFDASQTELQVIYLRFFNIQFGLDQNKFDCIPSQH